MSKELNVGIVGWKTGDNSFGATIPYLHFIQQFLGKASILTPESPFDKTLDLLIIPGGTDVFPLNYGEYPGYYLSKPDPYKEYFDANLLPEYILNDTPIFGICRGFQSLGVHFGAKLVQDMYHETNQPHENRAKLIHPLQFSPELRGMIGENEKYQELLRVSNYTPVTNKVKQYSVNSLHHQSILPSDDIFTSKFINLAQYTGDFDEAVEAMIHISRPIAAVQFHPEELGMDALSLLLIDTILNKQ